MNSPRLFALLLAALAVSALAMDGLAQDEDEDVDFDEDDEESSVAEERRAVESGRVDSEPGAKDSDLEGLDEGPRTKRTIKVLQKKNFLKIGRGELNFHAGFLSNDPFINRYLVGVGVGYHVTEIFSVHLDAPSPPTSAAATGSPSPSSWSTTTRSRRTSRR